MDFALIFIVFIVLITFFFTRKLYKYLLKKGNNNPITLSVLAFILLFIVLFIFIENIFYAIRGVKC